MYCDERGCLNPGHIRFMASGNINKAVTVEFCCWIQDTDVFSVFVDHLNKGLSLKILNINKPLTKKAGA